MRALVLFGSTSDENVYSELRSYLERDFDVSFAVISAHRDPQRLDERLSEDNFDVVFAGAGLAAHLPGVCASKTKKPVFGLPVEGNLGGLDALLSIVQMPFGIPVLAMSGKKWSSSIDLVKSFKNNKFETINLVATNVSRISEAYAKEVSRLKIYAETRSFRVTEKDYSADAININFVSEKNDIQLEKPLINVPLLDDKRKNDPRMSLELMEWINQGGFWVGINNSRNAICFAEKFRG